jgi:hypothetical protein
VKSAKFTAADLVPGNLYLSPSGRLCVLCPMPRMGPNSDGVYSFDYITRDGKPAKDEGFRLSPNNLLAISKMREADLPARVGRKA